MQLGNMRELLQSHTEELTKKTDQQIIGPPRNEKDVVEIPTGTTDNLRKRMLTGSRLANDFTETYPLPSCILLRYGGTNVALYGGAK
jgi:hypothetical protein